MTWVIGSTTPFGYGYAISDICVEFANGETRDMLQKIYPVGNYIVAGFSGSVKIGFSLIDNLMNFLKLPEGSENKAWHPDWVAEKWSEKAKEIFDKANEREKRLNAEILMVGISPNENIGDSDIPRSYVSILKSPDFKPKIFFDNKNPFSIGSGASVEEYVKALKNSLDIKNLPLLLKSETGFPGGFGHQLMLGLSYTIQQLKKRGISEHLHISIVRRGEIWIENSNRIEEKSNYNDLTICLVERGKNLINKNKFNNHLDNGQKKEKLKIFKMPLVAKTYQEFEKMVNDIKGVVSGATCK